ncbi:hypothetical protein KSX_56320 [Ktedonospora formicarum]|uniref:Uncharacterized protein n=1 Tax=Ktedonospora formicarum TaxID=2778364 RepID=A0A8J3IA25_9CHLR|nr:hypothetical protein KSX_56320 [Ktedonospora formicarum]
MGNAEIVPSGNGDFQQLPSGTGATSIRLTRQETQEIADAIARTTHKEVSVHVRASGGGTTLQAFGEGVTSQVVQSAIDAYMRQSGSGK